MRHSSRQRKYGSLKSIGSGLAALAISTAANHALAQGTEQSEQPSTEEVQTVTVIGTRASLKSARVWTICIWSDCNEPG